MDGRLTPEGYLENIERAKQDVITASQEVITAFNTQIIKNKDDRIAYLENRLVILQALYEGTKSGILDAQDFEEVMSGEAEAPVIIPDKPS